MADEYGELSNIERDGINVVEVVPSRLSQQVDLPQYCFSVSSPLSATFLTRGGARFDTALQASLTVALGLDRLLEA